jgi:hypothetical protein
MPESSFPDVMVNPINLRLRALDRVGTFEDTPLTVKESITCGVILRREAGKQPEFIRDIARDGDEYKIPRMTLMVGLLAPYGVMLKYPSAIIAMCRFLLGDTYDEEIKAVDWAYFRKFYTQEELM